MACYYPMEAIRLKDGSVKVLGDLDNGFHSKKYRYSDDVVEFLQVPCGKCIGCRLEYSRQWAIRCVNEMQMTPGECWFVTITYDNDHLPRTIFQEDNSGVRVDMPTLKPDDLQLFIKRVREAKRRNGESDIRFFACGEYGDKFHRPHYHIIFFNLNLPDLQFLYSRDGKEHYKSEFLEKTWDKGIVEATPVDFECCAYVARYVMKKALGPNGYSYASDNNLVEEFTRMSRRPGIGRSYYELYKEKIYKYDKQFIQTQGGTLELQPAKYYDKLYDVEYHDDFELLQLQRKHKAEKRNQVLMSQTSLTSFDYRDVLYRDKLAKIKNFSRSLHE